MHRDVCVPPEGRMPKCVRYHDKEEVKTCFVIIRRCLNDSPLKLGAYILLEMFVQFKRQTMSRSIFGPFYFILFLNVTLNVT